MLNCVSYIFMFAPLIAASCLSDFNIEFHSTCYFVSLNSTKFAAAELICRQKGGHLASIHDEETNDFIANQTLKSDLWIGLTNIIDSSNWIWIDNSDLDYRNWSNESDFDISNKNCASFFITDGYWYAEDCYKTKPFICQRPNEPICENGFVYFPPTNVCYGGHSLVTNWTYAEEYCEKTYNAHLPTIESFTEFQFVATYTAAVSQPYWIGIHFSNESETWITVNGSEPDFLNWCPGYPSNNQTSERCVAINTLIRPLCYSDEDCRENFYFRCKKEANIDFKYRSCPSRFLEWNSKCYFVSQINSEFDEAEATCNKMIGNLVSIHDGFENAVISQMYDGASSDMWIGLSNTLEPTKWEWADNTSFNYQNWNDTDLSNSTIMECASTSLMDGKWNATDCDEKKPFICEIEYQVPNCSDGWFYFVATESCYGDGEITGDRRGYNFSRNYCLNLGTNLPSIHSKYVFELMLSFVYSRWYNFWIGIRTFDGGKTWEADDGSAADFLDYGKWCDGYPQGESDERCVIVQPFNGGAGCYETYDCPNGKSHGSFSICQKPDHPFPLPTKTVLTSQILTSEVPATTTDAFSTTTTSTTMMPIGEKEKSSEILWYIGGSVVVIIILVVIFIIVFVYRRKRKSRQRKVNELFDGLIFGSKHGQLMDKYTAHFSAKLDADDIEIDFGNVLGKGSNSIVHRGHFKSKGIEITKVEVVAIKIPISFEKDDINLFMSELDAYITVGSHPHIINFYGWILYQDVPAIVMELATQNNLLLYVRSFSKIQISTRNFFSILLQISQALKHVAALNIIHRDVACRNILMFNNDYVKLADFGLCCRCNETEKYYGASRKKLPLKWLSIEALTQRKFSEKSDVWAFGILCYEMFSFGNEPYSTFSNDEMLEFLQSGKRLPAPMDTPESILLIMTNCWSENPDDRPTFAILEHRIKEILEDETAKYGYVAVDENFD